MTGFLIREGDWHPVTEGECYVRMEAKVEVMCPQSKEHPGLPTASNVDSMEQIFL